MNISICLLMLIPFSLQKSKNFAYTLSSTLQIADLQLNTSTFEVNRAGKPIKLSKKEYALLEYLMRHKAKILSKDAIINHVWNYDADVLPNTVEVYIGYLRNKIDQPFPRLKPLIHTVRGFGYKIEKGRLIPAENFKEVEEIFEEFLTTNISLTQLAKKHSFSVNGLKKILTNFTYIGKIKFNNQVHQGTHQPILSSTLFNHVQNKLERLGVKAQ